MSIIFKMSIPALTGTYLLDQNGHVTNFAYDIMLHFKGEWSKMGKYATVSGFAWKHNVEPYLYYNNMIRFASGGSAINGFR